MNRMRAFWLGPAVFMTALVGCQQGTEIPIPAKINGPDEHTAKDASANPPPTDERPALPFPPGVSLETVCGAVNDQQDVEFYDETLGVLRNYVDSNEKSVVQFQWLGSFDIEDKLGSGFNAGTVGGLRWCSGTLITNTYVLTAGHCFDIQDNRFGWISPFRRLANGEKDSVPPDVIATLQQVNFNYQRNGKTGALRPGIAFPIKQLIEHRIDGLDYAIVELVSAPEGTSIGVARTESRLPKDNEQIAILQHPQGKPKKIEAGNVLRFTDDDMWYDNLDTHSGSSGSGIRDASGAVIGVHTNGGCTKSGGANRGVTIAAIREASSEI